MLKEESTTTSVLELGSNNGKKWARSHDRAWVCEACESAPAAFVCKADAASLCVACDAEIHSANPLARRHHRVPIMPVAGCLYGPPAVDPCLGPDADDGFLTHEGVDDEDDQDEASSWLLLNPVKHNNTNNQTGTGFLFGGEVVDEYLDLEEYNSGQENHQCTEDYNNQQQLKYGNVVVPQKRYGGDSVVPVQSVDTKGQIQQQQYLSYQMEMVEYENPKTGYGYPASISHSVSFSFITKFLLCFSCNSKAETDNIQVVSFYQY